MKNLIRIGIMIIILQIANNISAQPYKSIFGKVSTEFYFYTTYGNELVYAIYGSDVNYNGKIYKRLSNGSYLSEDTLTGQVAMITSEMINFGESPFLLWSFDLMEGDTLESYAYGYHSIVDTIYYVNMLKVICINELYYGPISLQGEQVKFIEGTGCGFGFPVYFDMYHNYSAPQALLCVFKDGIKTYQNTDSVFDGNCEYFNIYENSHPDKIKLYPNPCSDKIQITVSVGNDLEIIRLFDEKLLMLKEINVQSNLYQLNVDDIQPGIYFLQVCIQDRYYYYKIIKL